MRPTQYQGRTRPVQYTPYNTHSLVSHTPYPYNVSRLTSNQLAHTMKTRV